MRDQRPERRKMTVLTEGEFTNGSLPPPPARVRRMRFVGVVGREAWPTPSTADSRAAPNDRPGRTAGVPLTLKSVQPTLPQKRATFPEAHHDRRLVRANNRR
jgi:hypothetical protein